MLFTMEGTISERTIVGVRSLRGVGLAVAGGSLTLLRSLRVNRRLSLEYE